MGRGRKHRPKWQIQVDAYLFHYVDDPKTIKAQKLRIRELELSGTRTTAAYELREGSGGGQSITKEERYVIELEQCREQVKISEERRAMVDNLLAEHFSPEEQTFIQLFWFDIKPTDRGLIWTRNKIVIDTIGWLRDPEDYRRPSENYWKWRLRIYNKWWDLLYPDMPKEETKADYIEHTVLEG